MRSQSKTYRKLSKCLYIYIGNTSTMGYGIFAAVGFEAGATIIADSDGDYYDHVLTYDQAISLGYYIHDLFQVGHDAFVLADGGIDDFMNHSCEPNCGVRLTDRGYVVVALRDILAGEQLTYDYSTYQNLPCEGMPCRCGSTRCRGTVENFILLPETLQAEYLALGIVGHFAMQPQPVLRRRAAQRAKKKA